MATGRFSGGGQWEEGGWNERSDVQVAELKEVFMLFDRDEDGVLSIQVAQQATHLYI